MGGGWYLGLGPLREVRSAYILLGKAELENVIKKTKA
jgi:hypothetical protein